LSELGEQVEWVIALMRERRVCRSFTEQPVHLAHLRVLAEAARHSPSASNQRINKFLVITERERIRLVRHVSPGMLGLPTALLVILTDIEKASHEGLKLDRDHRTRWADVGAAAENVLLAAEALGLGACPLMSFSVEGVRAVLEIPDHLVPDYIIQLGHAAEKRSVQPTRRPGTSVLGLTYWERVG
jgi:nitroreductase